MRLFFCLAILTIGAVAQNTCTPTGNNVSWTSAASWANCGGVTPQLIDTVSFGALNYNVNVDGAGAVAVAGIILGAQGTLSNADPVVSLTVNGNVTYAPNGTNIKDTFHFSAGSIYINGSYDATADFAGARRWWMHCSPTSFCNVGGSTGVMRLQSVIHYGTGQLDWQYFHGTKIGDAVNQLNVTGWTGGTVATDPVWILQDGDCDQCGYTAPWTKGGGTFTLKRVRFKRSAHKCATFCSFGSASTTPATIYNTIEDSVFDRSINSNSTCAGAASTFLGTVSLKGNIFEAGINGTVDGITMDKSTILGIQGSSVVSPPFTNSLVIGDLSMGNWEGTRTTSSGTISGNVFSPLMYHGGADTGTGMFVDGVGTYTITNNIATPQPDGAPQLKVFEALLSPSTITVNAKHNSFWIGGANTLGAALSNGHTASGINSTMSVASFNDNIFTGRDGKYAKFSDHDHENTQGCAVYVSVAPDVSKVGHNFEWPVHFYDAMNGNCAGISANAYGGTWSSTPPGVADIVMDFRLTDPYRTPILFATKYLGLNGTAASGATWGNSLAYTAGEYVIANNATIHNNASVLYRVKKDHTSSNDIQPGKVLTVGNEVASIVGASGFTTVTMNGGHPHGLAVGDIVYGDVIGKGVVTTVTNSLVFVASQSQTDNRTALAGAPFDLWHSYFDYAFRELLAENTWKGIHYIDAAINCTKDAPCTITDAIRNWIQVGWYPQNPAAWCAGLDGETAGAIPYCGKGKAFLAAAF